MEFLRRLFSKARPGKTDKARLYKRYRHDSFNLGFNILSNWKKVMNDVETVFTMPDYEVPQLFLQTVGKTDEFGDAMEFFRFAESQSDSDYLAPSRLTVGGYPAVHWEFFEPEAGLSSRALAVDVGPGIVWFYLKSTDANFEDELAIFEEIKATFQFS